jgi:hypothetical protein
MSEQTETKGQETLKSNQEILEELMDDLMAFDANDVRMFSLSVPATVSYGLKCWKSFNEDQDKFTAIFKAEAFDPKSYQDFEARLGTLWYTDALLQKAVDPQGDIAMVMEDIVPLHAKFAKAAEYLWSDDPKVGPIVRDLRSGSGYMDKADDLFRYVPLFEEHWDDIKDRCGIKKADVAEAGNLSSKYMRATVAVPDGEIARLRDLRNRAGEYLCRAVDDIRDAGKYVFRYNEKHLDRYPSLYKNNFQRRAKAPEQPVEDQKSLPEMPFAVGGPKLAH